MNLFCIAKSPKISSGYHEMLHKDNMTHNPEFRAKEHLYPNYEQWDHFLDAKMEQLDIKER